LGQVKRGKGDWLSEISLEKIMPINYLSFGQTNDSPKVALVKKDCRHEEQKVWLQEGMTKGMRSVKL